jgi:hypothetical protein
MIGDRFIMAAKSKKWRGIPDAVAPGDFDLGSVSDIPENETLTRSNAEVKVPRKVVDPSAVLIKRLR